jgi:uncharacterized membrane protein (DUF2068 family)
MNSSTATTVRRTSRPPRHKGGLRMVAVLEALKGALALLAAYVFISMIHRDDDFESAAENILFFFHIAPGRRLSQAFLNAADKMSDVNVMLIGGLAIAYAVLRFLEGYGLWKQRAWA